MVREHVGEYSPFSHRDALSPSEIIFGDDSISHFVVIIHKVSGGCAKSSGGHRFDSCSVAVVGEVLTEESIIYF